MHNWILKRNVSRYIPACQAIFILFYLGERQEKSTKNPRETCHSNAREHVGTLAGEHVRSCTTWAQKYARHVGTWFVLGSTCLYETLWPCQNSLDLWIEVPSISTNSSINFVQKNLHFGNQKRKMYAQRRIFNWQIFHSAIDSYSYLLFCRYCENSSMLLWLVKFSFSLIYQLSRNIRECKDELQSFIWWSAFKTETGFLTWFLSRSEVITI